MAVTLDQREIDEFLTLGHTLIFTTLDRDGYPHSTPNWYVYLDGHLYLRTRRKSQKVRNVGRDSRVCAVVESGELWRELKAVMVRGRAEEVSDEAERARFEEALRVKYEGFREDRQRMTPRMQQHYGQTAVCYKIVPEKKLATWDNRKVRFADG